MEIFPQRSRMESQGLELDFGKVVHTDLADDAPSMALVCEHASNRIPVCLGDMGLETDALQSHIAWDPGALAVAKQMAVRMSAPLVYGGVSRLVYDCNRPPEAAGAMPVRSENWDIPANANLSSQERKARIEGVYEPFRASLSDVLDQYRRSLELMVTVHSFTPIYLGKKRKVELGILHGEDDRFATSMMAQQPAQNPYVTRLNEPYSAVDGVAHTLDAQAAPRGLLNVMIEIRNDLIETPEQQSAVADALVPWIASVLSGIKKKVAM